MMTFVKTHLLIIIASGFIIAAAGFGIVLAYNHSRSASPVIFSQNALLLELWNGYKKTTIETGSNRTVDRQQDNISTSEGQSYAMLRAVWMDDRDTFDKSWQWTKNNLQRSDSLFSWKYGPLSNGSYGIQRELGGYNTASDGDSDIALSLIMAYSRWGEQKYLDEAKPIVSSIWKQEVVIIDAKPVLMANDLERNSPRTVVVNVSYFSPYAYKVFARIDPTHNWTALSDHSYDLISNASRAMIDTARSQGLPPDWILMDRQTGAIKPPTGTNTTNYGYDAMRTPWRLALDYQWFKDPRAKKVLSEFSYLGAQWKDKHALSAVYAHDGAVQGDYETPAMYGTAIGYFLITDPVSARQIYDTKLKKVYDPDAQSAVEHLSYYDANWAWFGIAMYQNALPNLTQRIR